MEEPRTNPGRGSLLTILRLAGAVLTIAGTFCMYLGMEGLVASAAPEQSSAGGAYARLGQGGSTACVIGGFVSLSAGLLIIGAVFLGPLIARRLQEHAPQAGESLFPGGPIYDPSSPREALARIAEQSDGKTPFSPSLSEADFAADPSADKPADEDALAASTTAQGEEYELPRTDSPTREGRAVPPPPGEPAPAGEETQAGEAESPPGVPCNRCGQDNPPQTRFCQNCGALLFEARVCPSCGDFNEPSATRCTSCGQTLS